MNPANVIKPMDFPEMEEHDELIVHIEEKPFFLDYEGCMRIHDDGLLSMIWERDEVD